SGGAITAINIVLPGVGYTTFPTITLGAVTGASGASLQVNANLTGISLTDAGMNFTGTPTVAVTGGGGSATATANVANLTSINANRGITVGANGGTFLNANNITYGGAVSGAGVATAGTFHKDGAGNINIASARGIG